MGKATEIRLARSNPTLKYSIGMRAMEVKNLLKILALAAFLLLTTNAWAQRMTEQQYQKLKTDITITHQSEFAADVANSDFQKISDAYNALASPAFWIWKSILTPKDVYELTTQDGTTWDWSTYQAQSVQERDAWNTMMSPGTINPSLAQVRAAFTKIFGGTGAPATQRTHLLTISRRQARRIEALLYITTLGDGSPANPANAGYEGLCTFQDVYKALTQTP